MLDIDPAKGGDDSLLKLEAQFGELPKTIEVVTGGGGLHYYFKHPALPVGNSTSTLGPGLDIKTDGGQVVAPPSIHPITQRAYAWEAAHHPNDLELAEVPPWLLQKLIATKEPGAPFVAPEHIPDGQRNDILYKTARSLKAKGLSREAMAAAIRAENTEKCAPPLAGWELDALIDHVWTQADRPTYKQPGSAPHDDAPPPGPAAGHQHDIEDFEITEVAGLYSVRSATHAVTMMFDRLTDVRGGVTAELSVALRGTELLAGVDLGLKSDTGHTKLAGSLKIVAPAIPWKLLIQRACSLVLKRHRRGEPPIHLTKDSTVESLTYAVNPLVFKQKTTILYGDGGVGKSTFALLCAMAVSTGQSVAGLSALKGRVLFLDYEDDADVHCRRLHALQAGHPELLPATVLYQRCVEPLTKLVYPLVRRIQDEGVTFVVLDSLIASTGGDASAEGTAKLFAALRLLNVEVLAVGHIPKPPPEGQGKTTVYGSVFNQNFARSVWEFKKEQDIGEDVSIVGLFNRKSNLSRQHHPIGLQVTQNEDNTVISYDSYDLSQAAELASALPLPNRIRNLLDDGEPRSSKAIADELGAPLAYVKATLSKYKKIKWHMIGENKGAQWTVLNH